jgi:hypothetical protein
MVNVNMKQIFISVCTFCLLSFLLLHAQGPPDNFQRLLQQNLLQYVIPPGFHETPVTANRDVMYDYAIKSNVKNLEIRYRIWPTDKDISHFDAMVVTMALNISGGEMIQTKHYGKADVKSEFGGDAGSTGMVRINSDFGKGYKFCMISAIHKNRIADMYTFYLFDDPNTVIEAISTDNIYHALRFK